MSGSNYVLRTLYIDPKLDERLKHEAYVSNTSKNELIRKYLEIGISTIDSGTAAPIVKKVKGVASQTATPSKKSVSSSRALLRQAKKKAGFHATKKASTGLPTKGIAAKKLAVRKRKAVPA